MRRINRFIIVRGCSQYRMKRILLQVVNKVYDILHYHHIYSLIIANNDIIKFKMCCYILYTVTMFSTNLL